MPPAADEEEVEEEYAWYDYSWVFMEPLGWTGVNIWIVMSFLTGAVSSQAKAFGVWEVESSGSKNTATSSLPSR
eukprot:COSAG06_NODE_291_length_18216_cov_13.929514_8_plen_74_part_00